MARNSKDDGLGCLFTLIFLPIVLIIAIIKDLIAWGVKKSNSKSYTKTTTRQSNNNQWNKKKENKKQLDYNEYWETHCESCGELLEDCECDWKGQSKQDISQDMDDLEFDEMNDIWDEMDAEDDDF